MTNTPVKLTAALAGITALFVDLCAAMMVLQKGLTGVKLAKISGELIVFSTAILILSVALKSLSELSWDELARGATGITALIGELIVASKLMATESKTMLKGSTGLIAMAAAILILAQAVKSISDLKWEELSKGLVGVGALLLEVAGFTQLVKPEKLTSTGIAMIAIGAALKIFASAIKDMGELEPEILIKGVAAIGGVLLEIAGFTQIVNPEKLVGTGVALIAIGAAMLIFASAIGEMGQFSWEEIGKGLVTMAGALTIITVAVNLMPATMPLIAAGLLVMSAALVILAQALDSMGGMTWEEIGKSLVVLAGALVVLAEGVTLMALAAPGAVALAVTAASLMLLAPALMLFGKMDLVEIGKALLTLVGVFVVVGGAAAILAPLTPVILGLSAAIALLGVGALAIGAGLLAFSAGLTALSISGTAGAAALVMIVASILSLIPVVCEKIAEGIIEFCKIIAKGLPSIMDAVEAIAIALIRLMVEITPPLVEAVFVLLMELLKTLVEFVPQIVDAGMKILLGFLEGIAKNIKDVTAMAIHLVAELLRGIADGIPDIVAGAVDLIVAFLDAFGKEVPRVVDAGFKMVIDFLNGIADAIRNNSGDLVAAVGNIGGAIVDGLIKGLVGGITAVKDAAVNLGKSALNAVKEFLGIHSPSKVFEEMVGKNMALGAAKGIDENSDKAAKAAKKMADDAYNNAKLWIKDYRNDTNYMASEELAMWEALGKKYSSLSKEKVEIDNNVRSLQSKIAKEKEAEDKAAFEQDKLRIRAYRNESAYAASEELAMWEELGKRYSGLSKEKVEIDNNIRAVQAKISKEKDAEEKASFEHSKKWIEEKKQLNELSLEEELAAWERVQGRYAEGTDYYKQATIKIFETHEKMRKEDYENTKNWVEGKKLLDELSLAEELRVWEQARDRYAVGTEERKKADKEVYNVKKQILKEDYENTKNWVEGKKRLEELSLVEEFRIWEEAQKSYAEGTDERKKADQELFDVRKRIHEEETKLLKEMDDAEDKYAKAVDDRAKSIAGTFALFSELKEKEEVSGSTLKKNLQDQVAELKDWANNLTTLSKKGIDQGLLDELRKMGPSANTEISALSKMTAKELESYANLWKEKNALARKQAVQELSGLRTETDEKITEIKASLNKLTLTAPNTEKPDVSGFLAAGKASIEAVVTGYQEVAGEAVAEASKISSDAKTEIDSWAPKYQEAGKALIQAVINGFSDKLPNVVANVKTMMRTTIGEITSFKEKFYEVGQHSVGGFIEGMRSKIEDAARMAAEVAAAAYQAAMDELGIHSPSREFFKLGKFSVLGMVAGLDAYAHAAEESASEVGSDTLRGFREAIQRVEEFFGANVDMTPTIRPVVDMSDVESGLNRTFGVKRGLTLTEAIGSASAISRNMSGYRQNGEDRIGATVSDRSFVFTQNNYSPKALSRIEIYRQTRNQISTIKGALNQA